MFLQVCKITDPAKQRDDENLTIDFFINNSDFSAAPEKLSRLKILHKEIEVFRKKVLPARNKIILHTDRHTVHQGIALGVVSNTEWDAFWLAVKEVVHILNLHFTNENIQINSISRSDVGRLIHILKQAEESHA